MIETLKERVDIVETRIDSLETVLGQFIVSVNTALLRLERSVENLKDEMKEFKDEMKEFKDEMREFKDEMKADRKAMNKRWGEIANSMGTIVEDIVAPNIPEIIRQYFHDSEPDFFGIRIRKRHVKTRQHREFDVIAVSEKYFIVNETKSSVKTDYINQFIKLLEDEIYDYFPEYGDKILIPIFSSLYIQKEFQTYLTRHKIYALAMKGEVMDLLNFKELTTG